MFGCQSLAWVNRVEMGPNPCEEGVLLEWSVLIALPLTMMRVRSRSHEEPSRSF